MTKRGGAPLHICQSPEWQAFKKTQGNLPVKAGGAVFFKTKIPFLPFFVGYCPKADFFQLDFSRIKQVAKRERCLFVKFDFNNLAEEVSPRDFPPLLREGKSVFAPETVILDVSPPLKEIKKGLKAKTRYNIRLAEKRGVKIRQGGLEDLPIFLELQRKTATRQGFYTHSDRYFRQLAELFFPKKILRMLIGEVNGKPAVAWLFFVYQGVFYYPYGASDYQYRRYMASSLMMWSAIKLAKKLGCARFDLWGATSDKTSAWWGFTRFKLSFGGKLVCLAPSADLVINRPLYHAFRLADWARWRFLWLRAKLR